MPMLPEMYYRLRQFEISGRFYERLGVRCFKRIVPTGGDYVNRVIAQYKPGFRFIKNEESARQWLERTRQQELVHIVWFLLSLPVIGYCCFTGHAVLAIFFFFLNVPFTAYPIMLQRYNRARLFRMLNIGKRTQRRPNSTKPGTFPEA